MPHNLRVATFNCENLFSRPRIFAQTPATSKELLGYVAELQEALKNDIFDKARIKELEEKLKGFATVNDLRGKHDSNAVIGAKDWLGGVELTRTGFSDAAVENTARVISDVDADVICLIEVEERSLLQKFHDGLLYKDFLEPAGKSEYKYVYLIDGNDPRGIDVAFLSRIPVTSFCSHIHETTLYEGKTLKTFSRDCLEVELVAPNGKPLHLMINHFKSMGYSSGNDLQSNRRRLGQAQRVAELLDRHNLKNDYVIVAGDLNSDPSSPSMQPLITKPNLYNTLLNLPASQRGTYGTDSKQLDYILVSDALKQHIQDVKLERRGVYSKTKWVPYPTVKNTRTQASDHAAVIVEFLLP
ncbi:endonuclease/exonuclease/phosphatase [Fibrisoma limi BUZ 3]|uniref:Endonuclease/exonuclease/phosphatase n=1 Tax=Fibrisoma limi BUZ 3 TaxID=1185876 RepID=I2GRL2_9BACT|nr:endonuclease/exonuclease/phosphatase family protein [Fibrisoma limi]CCH56540.1 endonuclease/exonuclease/phosphatase [Fibrisoma limi BUZ 3]